MHQCSLFEKGRIIALRGERRSVALIAIWNLFAKMKIRYFSKTLEFRFLSDIISINISIGILMLKIYFICAWVSSISKTREGWRLSKSFLSCNTHWRNVNPRPAGVFGRTHPAGEGGGGRGAESGRVAVARWARRQTNALDEYFLSIF